MLDFTYYAPTKMYFGKEKHKEVGAIIAGYGYKRIMLQYGKGSIKSSGLYDEVMASLKAAEIEVVEMGGVQPNPTLEFVREAVKVAKERQVELILAVGGGSVLDSSKYTAAGACYDGDPWDFPTRKAVVQKALPVGCILTISAAGSEMSGSAVISNEELKMKRGFGSEFNRCLFSICNPELTYSVSPYQTACGIVDMMAHTMERYFTPCPDTPLTDRLAEGLLKSVVEAGKVAMQTPTDYEARATLMWASSLAHNDLTSCGRDSFLAVHQLEHALSGEDTSIAHGAGLAVLYPAWAKYVWKQNPARFAQFARGVWGVEEADDQRAAEAGIAAMEQFFKEIGMPLTLRELGLSEAQIPALADLCTFNRARTIKSYIELGYDEIVEIFELCY